MNEYLNLLLDAQEEFSTETALVDHKGERATDYKTFGDFMLRAASYVHSKNLGDRSYVPVRMESSMECAACVCGIWLAGHAAVPMGKSFPEERVKYICMNCDAPFVMDETVLDDIRNTEILPAESFRESEDEDVALLLYTSGSTGMPKGILHSFGGLIANQKMGKREVYSTGQRWAMGAPFYFVASIAVYKVLTCGGCVHLLDEETMRDVKKLEDYYEANKITVGFISPSVLSNFHNRAESLKIVMTGSERLTGQCSRDGYKLFNNYGMSETMGTVCSFLVEKPYDTTPVGIPPEGSVWALLDDEMNPVPDGEEGEYCTKGPYTVGYFKDPEATEKLFRGGWLHTGDILKKLPDGNLVYINRKDWMVKINGQRVEPGEIENVLRNIEGIDKCVVKAVKGNGDQIALCAYYTGEKLDESVIREKLAKKVAPYMVPGFYLHMDQMPINQNGKIDRKNLPEPDLYSKKSEYAPPENDTQAMLCRGFEETLCVDQVGIDDDFLAMGGDSIRVMKLASLCPELSLTSKIIYSLKTPRKIAEECEKTGAAKVREKKESYPLSSSQLGIYIESMNRDGEAVYNNPILLRIGNGVDMDKLGKACEAVVKAHPFIKLKLKADEDGNPVQLRNEDSEYKQTVEKLSEEEFQKAIPTLMQPFRLLSDDLFRIRLFETDKGKYFFADIHHIIFDGSSMLVLMKDLERAYLGATPETEVYSGFEVAEDEQDRRVEEYEEAKKWYMETFGGIEADSLPIPDRREKEPSFGVCTLDMALEASDLEALCRKYGITENIFTTAAFGLCTGLYSGMQESLFTTIYNGRESLRTARTIAMLVKTLPVYSRFEKEETVRDYMTAAKEQMIGTMNHDIYPFSDLAAETGINSSLMFVYQGDVLNVDGFAGEDIERIPLMDNSTAENLAIQMFKQGGLYNVRAEYRSDLYSEELIRIFLRSYENVLKKLLSAETVGEVSLAGFEEIEKLKKWNKTEVPYDKSATAVSIFRQSAEKYPDNTCVIYESESYTYREVDEKSDRIAAYIKDLGIERGDVVSILIPRGPWMVIASIGALKAGCAYQPLDSTYPSERLNFMVKDADARLLITDRKLGELITGYEGERLYIEDMDKLPEKKVSVTCEPDDVFILLYTSGSTGVPKGVRLTHGNIVCFIDWARKFYGITPSDCSGQYASYGFDACMMDMYPMLGSGAAICIVPEEMRLDLNSMNEYYIKHKVTLTFMTTQVGRQFAAEMDNPFLRELTVGGEKLASMEPPRGFAFYNAYGPTEGTILSTIYQVTRLEDNIPIGRPLDNLKCYVVDLFGHILPPGALGELLIAGPHVAAGYLNRPEKTAEVFIDNPFDDGEYRPAYRTGDIVRYRVDGEIEFIGRRDGQVKIHGFRIELSEVEAVIRSFDGIRDACVVARDLGADGKAVVAYFVSDKKIDPEEIAEYIRERKPPYMVPSSIMQLDAIPLNQNGKVNKRALPEPEVKADEADGKHIDNALEKELKNIIGQSLGMENPPLNTPLQYLGFTSISVIRLSTKLMKRFEVNIPVREMKDLTIAAIEDMILQNWLGGETKSTKESAAGAAEAVGSREALSAAQTGIYLDCMRNTDSTAYNIPSVITLDHKTDIEKLKSAIGRVLSAHPSVFVHFDIGENRVEAVRDEVAVPVIPVMEMTEKEIRNFADGFVQAFHLNRGPLFRFALIKTENSVKLFTDFHHLVFDGFSMNLFLKEFGEALRDENTDPAVEGASYFTYVRNQKEQLAGDPALAYEKYFEDLLADYEAPTEITGNINGDSDKGKKAFIYLNFDEGKIGDACANIHSSEAGFFLAALDYTLARLTASENIYIATISSGRSDIRFADTFGMFVNTLPLASHLSDGSVNDFVRETDEGLDAALKHENYPFADVAGKWGYAVRVMYEYQRGVVEKPDIPGMTDIKGLDPEQAKFPVTVRVIDRNGKGCIEVEYNDALYSEKFMEEFAKSIMIAAEKFAASGRDRLRSISLLDKERETVLEGYHSRKISEKLPADILFHSGIERHAKEKPDQLAITAVDGDYTYRELNENANRAANALIRLGVKKGDRVILLLPRTARFFFALYGVLKTGAAYIPCDPGYPVERIRQIIEDSDAKITITTSDRLTRFNDKKAVDIEELLKESNNEKPEVEISQEDLAYLIYTSGSTGKPKGVMLRHRGIVNYVTDTEENILMHAMATRGHVLTAVTTFSFDFSIKEWGAPLFLGLTLSVAADDEVNDASKLAKRMKATGTDIFGSTPSRLMTLMESDEFHEAADSCRILINGGEKYPDKLLKNLKKKDRLIFNTYGPTETTVSSNTQELSSYDMVNVGRPLPGVTEYIVDIDGNEVPEGVVGELYIGGIGVATGYYGLPEMTEERFISYRGERVYRSGDFARWTEDGNVEILGRRDNQIKLRGLRIELDEVDAVLSSMPGIERTAIKIEKINGIEHLCAWFTADHPMDIGELKLELGRTLTNYMVPTAYMQLEEMPVTPNGKLDLKNLPLPELYRSGKGGKADTPAEKDFSEIFTRILHVENVGADENFFELGGTSLLVTQVVIEAVKKGYRVSFGDVFDNPTPGALAELSGKNKDTFAASGSVDADSEILNYDYSAINDLLNKNTLESFKKGEQRELGNVLLTGAAGYLGIHILHELIEREDKDKKIYCLLRSREDDLAEDRLKRMYFYYFEVLLLPMFGSRIIIVDGDVTDPEAFGALEGRGIDTVINCAAVVKHFSSGTEIEDVNLGGALNIIDFCLKTGARMIQTSTMSVVTSAYKDNISEGFLPAEQTLFCHQMLDNKYVHSKFLSERAVLAAVADKGLKGKVMRFGNLAARYSDGEFQINFTTNSAMGRLKAFTLLKCAAYDQLDTTMEFSPIDAVAEAVVKLSRTPDECTLFHVFNNQNIFMEGIFHELNNLGYEIEYVEREDFAKAFREAQSDPEKAEALTSIIAYMELPDGRETVRFKRQCEYTMQVLYRLGFAWPITTWDYIERFVSALRGLEYFEEGEEEITS
ncbi:MAG: amino acid adenylation domain-containing protein [Lachnospiraceae bacterium]|nr:amino acid adenylation domain-containing protein [Lachnospiraceae bacterium]